MNKHKKLVVKCLIFISVFILILSLSVYAAEPSYYDGVENKLGTSTSPFFFANGTEITIEEPLSNEYGAVIKWNDGEQCVPNNVNVFGGSHNSDEEMTTSITMNGGVVNSIFGGGLHRSHVTESNVVINEGTINVQVIGGGASSFTKDCGCADKYYAGNAKESPCVVEEANVTIKDGAEFKGNGCSLLFGGGEGISCTNVANLVIDGGKFSDTYVTAGGSNGYTGEANIEINDGNFGTVVQGVNRGSIDKISMNINGGTFNNVYVGGETADSGVTGSYTSAKINISGDVIIKKLLPGSNGKTIIDDSTKITGKVEDGIDIKNILSKSDAETLFSDVEFFKYIVTEISLNKSEATINGEVTSITLIPTVVAGSGVSDKTVNWNSSNKGIVTVTNGVVTVANENVKNGAAKITATVNADDTKYAECTIIIAIPVSIPENDVNVESDSFEAPSKIENVEDEHISDEAKK